VFADTKCPFSAAAARELPVVASGLAGHDITTVLVNIGDPEPTVKTAYAAGIAGTAIVYDAGKQTQEAWKVQFVPTVFLLDKAGSAVYRGSPVWAKVASALADHLGLPAGSVSLDAQGTTGG
jgi:hypothetical protein